MSSAESYISRVVEKYNKVLDFDIETYQNLISELFEYNNTSIALFFSLYLRNIVYDHFYIYKYEHTDKFFIYCKDEKYANINLYLALNNGAKKINYLYTNEVEYKKSGRESQDDVNISEKNRISDIINYIISLKLTGECPSDSLSARIDSLSSVSTTQSESVSQIAKDVCSDSGLSFTSETKTKMMSDILNYLNLNKPRVLKGFALKQSDDIYSNLFASVLSAEYLKIDNYVNILKGKIVDEFEAKIACSEQEGLMFSENSFMYPYFIKTIYKTAQDLIDISLSIKHETHDITNANECIPNKSTLKSYDTTYSMTNLYAKSVCVKYHFLAKNLCFITRLDHNFYVDYESYNDLMISIKNIELILPTFANTSSSWIEKIKIKAYVLLYSMNEECEYVRKHKVTTLDVLEFPKYCNYRLWSENKVRSLFFGKRISESDYTDIYNSYSHNEHETNIFEYDQCNKLGLEVKKWYSEIIDSVLVLELLDTINEKSFKIDKHSKEIAAIDVMTPLQILNVAECVLNKIMSESDTNLQNGTLNKSQDFTELRMKVNRVNQYLEAAKNRMRTRRFLPLYRPPFNNCFYKLSSDIEKGTSITTTSKDDKEGIFISSFCHTPMNINSIELKINELNRKSREISDKLQVGLVKSLDAETKGAIKEEGNDVRKLSIQFLGIFAGFLAFVSSAVGIVKIANNIWEFIIFMLSFVIALIIFAVSINYLNHRNNPSTTIRGSSQSRMPYVFIVLLILLLLLDILLGCYYFKCIGPSEQNRDKVTLHIEMEK